MNKVENRCRKPIKFCTGRGGPGNWQPLALPGERDAGEGRQQAGVLRLLVSVQKQIMYVLLNEILKKTSFPCGTQATKDLKVETYSGTEASVYRSGAPALCRGQCRTATVETPDVSTRPVQEQSSGCHPRQAPIPKEQELLLPPARSLNTSPPCEAAPPGQAAGRPSGGHRCAERENWRYRQAMTAWATLAKAQSESSQQQHQSAAETSPRLLKSPQHQAVTFLPASQKRASQLQHFH